MDLVFIMNNNESLSQYKDQIKRNKKPNLNIRFFHLYSFLLIPYL